MGIAISPVLLHSAADAVVVALVAVLIAAWWRAIRRTDISPIEALFDMDFEAVILLDPDGRIMRANQRFLDLARASLDDVEGHPLLNFVTGWSQKRVVTGLREARGGSREAIEIGIARAGGHVDACMICGPQYDRRRVVGVWGLLRDITEQKQAERALEDRALHDFLTGLPNRALFNDRLEHAVQRSRRGGRQVALLYVDLDGFKRVNDTAGHPAGDEVLREVALRLVSVARAGDTVGRIGGDEFGVLLETSESQKEAMGVAGRILSRIQQPITVDGGEIHVGASIGIAMSGDDARDTEELVRRADLAMYEAKRRGGLQRHMYSSELEREPLHLGARIETDLPAALEGDELYLEYQPIVDLSGRTFAGIEALVRWEHPEFGIIRPSVFVPVAERSSIIVSLDRWVLDRACSEMRRYLDEPAAALTLSLKLSDRHFDEPDFVEGISAILARHELDPRHVQFEITESAAGNAREAVRELKALGSRVAIHDFGAGYSSLAYLRDLDIDALKVDRSFALSLGADPASVTIVRTILTLAEMLDVEVIIEGVEYAAQLDRLQALGGRYVQGYMFGRPVSATRLPEVLASGPVIRPGCGDNSTGPDLRPVAPESRNGGPQRPAVGAAPNHAISVSPHVRT